MTDAAPLAVVSLSGGKDSTATALLALDRRGAADVRLVMADTGNEHPDTLAYATEYLPGVLGVPVTVVRADFSAKMARKRAFIARNWEYMGVPLARIDRAMEVLVPTGNPFLDLCMWKGRFPSRKAQFCTDELKGEPLAAFMDALPGDVALESWRGVRRDESINRRSAKAEYSEATDAGRLYRVMQPIVDWTAAMVIEFVLGRGVEHNPLYRKGMRRVGCMPCINCGKDEVLEISRRFPEHVDRIREWETLVGEASKRGVSTFFADPIRQGDGRRHAAGQYARIDEVVAWSKTSRGGRQMDMQRALGGEEASVCSSLYGLCE